MPFEEVDDLTPVVTESNPTDQFSPTTDTEAPAEAGITEVSSAPAPQSSASIREYVSALGYQVGPEATDDSAVLINLVNRARQVEALEQRQRETDIYTRLGQQLAPQSDRIRQFLSQPQTQTPAQPKAWEAPSIDPRWVNLVEQDPTTGVYLPKAGVDPEIARKVNAYSEWTSSFQRDPAAVLQPMVREVADAQIKEAVAQAIQQERQRNTVQAIHDRNAEWFYARDQAGNPIYDAQSRQYVPTPQGSEYLAHVRTLAQSGVSDPVTRDNLAQRLMAANQATLTTPQATAPSEAQRRALAASQPNRNPLQAMGAQERRETPGTTDPDQQGVSLSSRLTKAFGAAGINSANFSLDS